MLYFGICLSLHLGFRQKENRIRLADNSGEILELQIRKRIRDWFGFNVIGIAKDGSEIQSHRQDRRESSQNFEDHRSSESLDQGGCSGQSNRVLRSEEPSETAEVGA